jgi:hypothetical protein
VAALISAGCARSDPQLARVEGAEPQRLSFGKPQAVRAAFAEKMQACWFSGTYPLLGGYQSDAKPGIIEVANSAAEAEQITISTGRSGDEQVFVVQFSPFNDNTLISTRDSHFPPELAARMKRDVETWIFGRSECGAPGTPGAYTPPLQNAVQTQQAAAPRQQQASAPGADETTGATPAATSKAALSRAPN